PAALLDSPMYSFEWKWDRVRARLDLGRGEGYSACGRRRRVTSFSSASARATPLLLPIGPPKRGARSHSQSLGQSARTTELAAPGVPPRLGASDPAWWAASLRRLYWAQTHPGRSYESGGL